MFVQTTTDSFVLSAQRLAILTIDARERRHFARPRDRSQEQLRSLLFRYASLRKVALSLFGDHEWVALLNSHPDDFVANLAKRGGVEWPGIDE